jgi:hypothetical protein
MNAGPHGPLVARAWSDDPPTPTGGFWLHFDDAERRSTNGRSWGPITHDELKQLVWQASRLLDGLDLAQSDSLMGVLEPPASEDPLDSAS